VIELRGEIWTFCQKKQRQVKAEDSPEVGDAWVFVAIDAESKLIPAWTIAELIATQH
jgi:hypothetical protein